MLLVIGQRRRSRGIDSRLVVLRRGRYVNLPDNDGGFGLIGQRLKDRIGHLIFGIHDDAEFLWKHYHLGATHDELLSFRCIVPKKSLGVRTLRRYVVVGWLIGGNEPNRY
jgi:hypothetical protein